MTKFFLVSATVVAMSVPSVAAAQEGGNALSGIRFELSVGQDRMRGDFSPVGNNANESGVLYGATIGYDVAVGNALSVGVDAELSDTTTDGVVRSAAGATLGQRSFGREIYVGGRATFGISPLVALTGKVGYSYLETEYVAVNSANSTSGTLKGPRGAAGVLFNTGGDDGTYFGAEARFADYKGSQNRRALVLTIGHRF